MTFIQWRSALQYLKHGIQCALLYVLVLGGGVLLFLIVSSAIGYLPYSDRPGPGWFSPHMPTSQEIGLFASWALFFVGPFALIWGSLLYVFIVVTSWLGAPKWLLRILGGLFAGALGLLGIEAAGWNIAIAASAVYGGAILGLLFGAFLLPRFATVRAETRWQWRWVAIIAATGLFAMGIIYPMLPNRDAQTLDVRVVRLVSGPEELTSQGTNLTQENVTLLNSLGLRGRLHEGIQSSSCCGDKQAQVLVIVRGRISTKVTLRIPKASNVVYVQDGENWQMHPANAPTLRKTITLTDNRGEFEGLSITLDSGVGKPNAFTWYPPIRRDGY